MKKVATAFLTISLLATTPVFAAEQESNQIQQEEGMTEQGEGYYWSKDLTVDEILAQEGMKSALESFCDKFPQAKAYKIMGSKVEKIENDEKKNVIHLFLASDEKESFFLEFDIETEKITEYTQAVENISESELPDKVQASLDKVYSLSPEVKNLKLYGSTMYSSTIKGEEGSKKYSLRFNESGKIVEGKTTGKEFSITFDETGKVLYFYFDSLPLVNLEGNTKEEKAQDLLKRLYGEEANEYKIKKVNEISKDDPNYKENKDFMRGSIVFMPTSSEKEPILVQFNTKDELTMSEVTTRDFLEDVGLL
ncbi:hypothetical protein [Aneurinibacillus migulanus]|uniref:Peptidase propeptide and YPEB domain-containing protein n=1 Tax=Aneurinibacillus migulanus TaxID=47500 RepID=A0A0D1XTA9_ANEMI|nr:hypothetical protein [Aneurinibacillus migulanus]KIV55388.1 hypothetical protein TS65_16605 [Aneurinibacillus migulanus]KON99399.1 hypothetical protein AF333_01390 [Aneurinibacillus migulanus]MED0893021.1 hypothetical protein [Aneurinibacillus migulanus]MED1614692.1 hypothetical protein [Aneurinibacillus migulanus]SDK35838.1 hypothetical protein SAMN04487909_15053 [Aneurinibacillus migulanus]